jgi:hypothetical protein
MLDLGRLANVIGMPLLLDEPAVPAPPRAARRTVSRGVSAIHVDGCKPSAGRGSGPD